MITGRVGLAYDRITKRPLCKQGNLVELHIIVHVNVVSASSIYSLVCTVIGCDLFGVRNTFMCTYRYETQSRIVVHPLYWTWLKTSNVSKQNKKTSLTTCPVSISVLNQKLHVYFIDTTFSRNKPNISVDQNTLDETDLQLYLSCRSSILWCLIQSLVLVLRVINVRNSIRSQLIDQSVYRVINAFFTLRTVMLTFYCTA